MKNSFSFDAKQNARVMLAMIIVLSLIGIIYSIVAQRLKKFTRFAHKNYQQSLE